MDIKMGTLPSRDVTMHYELLTWDNVNSIGIRVYDRAMEFTIVSDSLPHLLNLHRDLGEALDSLQPGLINPLPDKSPDLVDALKVIFVADQIRKGIK